jgi:DNA-binding transcriptional regulator YiaG
MQEKEGESPLLVMDQSPLDVLLERLNMTQKDFCAYLGYQDSSSYRKWRKGQPMNLPHIQAKRLDRLMREAGLNGIQDLPDDLRPYKPQSA